ncbi:MAG: HAMP domain-containing histidine kinase [Bryobacterales bacterium]|nr:HAMP domain-containing histidine kinase [Bryobacterales bacterium]
MVAPEPNERYRTALQALETREANFRLFTRSLAHDFNNLLGGILGHAGLIQLSAETNVEVQESAAVILKAAERARELVTQLLDSTRPDLGQFVTVNLHETIREVASLVRGIAPAAIRISFDFKAETAETVGDPGQLHHLILNLALNARDAMPEGGELTFETTSAMTPYPTIQILVRDTGTGIPDEIQSRIFEPSFTTKGGSRGSGMGLAIADRIVQHHGGRIQVESKVGHGSVFLVTLPLRQPAGMASAATA